MAIDKKRLVVNEKQVMIELDGNVVMQPPRYYNRTRLILTHLATTILVLGIFVSAALLCAYAFKKEAVKSADENSNGQQKVLIKFGSMIEHVISDPSTRMTHYHVTGPDDEIWAVDDYNEGLHVIKVADVGDGATCYVTSLDGVILPDFSLPLVDTPDQLQTEILVTDEAEDAEQNIISFVADYKPIFDASMLGSAGQELCGLHPIYPMWRLSVDEAPLSETDTDRPSIKTYVIEHRNVPAAIRRTLSPDSGDTIGLRVRRHEQRLNDNGEEEDDDETKSSPHDEHPVAESSTKVFRLWDYFGRRRTRTRRDDAAVQQAQTPVEQPQRREGVRETQSMAASGYRLRDRFTRPRQRRSSTSRRRNQQAGQEGRDQPRGDEDVGTQEQTRVGAFRVRGRFGRTRS